MLDSDHEDDIVPVILKKPNHHQALAVALHVGHRFTHVEWGTNPAYRYGIGNPGRAPTSSRSCSGCLGLPHNLADFGCSLSALRTVHSEPFSSCL